jgi:hypothetical protein
VAGVYEKQLDRESAYEKLTGQAAAARTPAPAGGGIAAGSGQVFKGGTAAPAPTPTQSGGGMLDSLKDVLFGTTGPRGGHHPGLAEAAARSAVRTMGSAVGREIIRGVLGSILGGSGSRRR